MIKKVRVKRVYALLLVLALLLTPMHSYAENMPEDVSGNAAAETPPEHIEQDAVSGGQVADDEVAESGISTEEHEMNERVREQGPGVTEHEAAPFSLGSNGYYIINGANMVSGDNMTVYGLSDGIYVQEANQEEYLLCTDEARNLNIRDGMLYYTTRQNDTDYIKIIDMDGKLLEKSFQMADFHVRHMYLVSNSYLLFSSGGRLYSLDLETEEICLYREYEDVFSFIPTKQGILYAKGSLFDYALYAEDKLLVEHVSDYYIEEDVLVYRLDGREYRAEAAALFSDDLADIEEAYTDKSVYETVTAEEFVEAMREVVPTEEEESEKPRQAAEIQTTFSEDRNVMFSAESYGIQAVGDICAAAADLTPARTTEEQRAIKERAEEIYNDVWTTLEDVRKWSADAEAWVRAGTTVHGIIYCQPVNNGKFVLAPGGMSWEEYKQERASADSKLYSKNKDDWANFKPEEKNDVRYGPKYGSDCSTFASYCWDLERRYTTREINVKGKQINTSERDFMGIQVGDIINRSGDHVVVITGIEYDSAGNIGRIETIEQTVPYTKKNTYNSYSEFRDKRDKSGYKFSGYYLYRSLRVENANQSTTKLTLSESSHMLYFGDTFQLKATATPGGKITWTTSNKSIAVVDQNGRVTAVGKKTGVATITATLKFEPNTPEEQNLLQATCKVQVKKKSLTITGPHKIYLGIQDRLIAKTEPQAPVKWESQAPAIIKVSQNGEIEGLKRGTTTIYATANGIRKGYTVTVSAPTFKLQKSAVSVYRGDTVTIKAIPTPDTIVQWSSSNASVAKVDNQGRVTGVRIGQATITAKAHGITKTCTVKVKAPTFKLDKSSLSVYRGSTWTIKATPMPSTTVQWSSSNASVAKVDSQGKVTGVRTGKATITAQAHGIKKTCTVTVKAPTFKLDKSSLSVYRGSTGTIKATPMPSTTVQWSSSNASVAKVDNQGRVTGVKIGQATITAKAHGITKTCTVTVKAPTFKLDKSTLSVYRGGTGTIKATPTPSTTVQWSSSNASVAKVDNQGRVTGIKIGQATITAKAHGITKTCTVTVKAPTFKLDKSTLSVYRGSTGTIKATPTPSTTVQWTSSNPSIAKVDGKGTVTGVKVGTATITARAHGITKTCKVTVNAPTLKVPKTRFTLVRGQTADIGAKAAPAAKITYVSQNQSVAYVDSRGKIRANRPGNTKIRVSANGITIYVQVKVI